MIRQAPRHLLRCSRPLHLSRTQRFLSTAPPAQKSRSWKSSAVRWGLAIGVVYYYNTSNLFAEEPPFAVPQPSSPTDETPLPTLESLASSRRQQPQSSPLPSPSSDSPTPTPEASPLSDTSSLESEASQEGAFNEETGVINWDCPCLGGMAHGPCGEQFKAAFSCFVYSKEEVKGMDCIEHFKTMQDCFREFPDVYGGELEEESEEGAGGEVRGQGEGAGMGSAGAMAMEDDDGAAHRLENAEGAAIPPAATSAVPTPEHEVKTDERKGGDDTERAKKATEQVRREHGEGLSESEAVVPKAALDATGEK